MSCLPDRSLDSGVTPIVIGGGGHAKVVMSSLLASGWSGIAGFVAPASAESPSGDHPIVGDDAWLQDRNPDDFILFNGIGFASKDNRRRRVYEIYTGQGFKFGTVVHPRAYVAAEAEIVGPCEILAGAIIQPCARIGANTTINTAACVDHDCIIGDHSHIAPGSRLSGGVRVGRCCLLGIGSTVVQNVTIGDNAIVGAGSTVISDVPSNSVVVGSPARLIENKIPD